METLNQLDHQLFRFVNQIITNDLFDFFCPIIRERIFMAACYLMFGAIMQRAFPDRFLEIAAAGAFTFLLTDQVSASLVKPFFHRLRPCNDHHIVSRLIVEHCGSGFSFVSTHATNSFGIASFLSLVRRKKRTIAILFVWATLVCFSQVYVGVHYPSDVIAGGMLGTSIGAVTGFIYIKIIAVRKTNP